ncbi:MAG: GDP-L-fucose synthase family protein [Thermodesulfobacteriota bacterium]
MKQNARIYIAGHKGLVGSALHRALAGRGYTDLLVRDSAELDLTRQAEVDAFFAREKPEYVFLAAAKVGGILANNNYPAEFIYINLMIQTNVIHAAWKAGVTRLLFLGSSCIYPRECPQPMREEYLLTGSLEQTNEPYAVAKIAGIKMCQSYNRQYGTRYLSVMPTNLFGPFDNFHPENSHVLPALIRRFHEAREQQKTVVEIWGTGTPRREFLFVDDLAEGCVFLMNLDDETYTRLVHASPAPLVNIGVGMDLTIRELAEMIRGIAGFAGEIRYDRSKPDGTPRKLLDVSRMNAMGWTAGTPLRDGIGRTYAWCLENRVFETVPPSFSG